MTPKKRARRAWGSGSVSERRPGVWRITISGGVDPWTKKRRQITRTVTGTRADAQAALDALRASLPRNPETTATINVCIDQWRQYNTVRAHTLVNQDGLVRKWIVPTLGDRRARDLTPLDVEAWAKELARRKASPTTVRNALGILSAILQVAVRHEWIDDNPVRKAAKPKVPRRRRPYLLLADVHALRDAATERDAIEAAWFRLVVVTGARRSEVLALRWTDLHDGAVTIERTLVQTGGGWSETDTKTGDVRTIPLDKVTVATLVALRGHLEAEARRGGVEFAGDGFILPSALDGRTPIMPKRASDLFRELAAKARVSGFHLHDLRHFTAKKIMEELDAESASHRLGHARTSMTIDVYGSPFEGSAIEASEVMARALDG